MLSKTKRGEVKRRFRLLRIAVNKTQIEVEQDAALPAGRYWKYENGVLVPEGDERKRLARALKVSPDDIPGAPCSDEAKAS
jgi:transcriptional regulator with XRE-family HTH domain